MKSNVINFKEKKAAILSSSHGVKKYSHVSQIMPCDEKVYEVLVKSNDQINHHDINILNSYLKEIDSYIYYHTPTFDDKIYLGNTAIRIRVKLLDILNDQERDFNIAV